MPDEIKVTVFEHPKGDLLSVTGPDWSLSLNRDEALDLLNQIQANIGKMRTTSEAWNTRKP